MLEELGHEVVQVESGATALDLLRSRHFDLMITDYLMPGMSGLELARAARRTASALPILMITGYANLASEDELGVTRIAKPFQLDDLSRAIEQELQTSFSSIAPSEHGS